ncbi:MAG: hypothetical protein KGJ45_11480 [Elusimicrobia bacterium]|nr:hypothetical protein [Elusimicrobiota bacterium]
MFERSSASEWTDTFVYAASTLFSAYITYQVVKRELHIDPLAPVWRAIRDWWQQPVVIPRTTRLGRDVNEAIDRAWAK